MDRELYIPLGIKVKKEIFIGFGKKECIQSLLFMLGFGMLDTMYFLISQNTISTIVALLSAGFSCIMFLRKNDMNLSIVDLATYMIRFRRAQKKYSYRYQKEWNKF